MYKVIYPLLLVGCLNTIDNEDAVILLDPDGGSAEDSDSGDAGNKQPCVLVDASETQDSPDSFIDAQSDLDGGSQDADAADAQQDADCDADAESVVDADIQDAQADVVIIDPPVDPPNPYVEYDINHILSTGQSNSVANGASPALTTTQPYDNIMFNTGVMTALNCGGQVCPTYETPSSFVPLREGDKFFDYPVETMSSAMANQITNLSPDHVSLVSLHGRSGNVYNCLRQNSCSWFPNTDVKPFEEGMRQVRDGLRLAQAQNKSYVVRAVTAVHGESDAYNNIFPQPALSNGCSQTPFINSYRDALLEWQCTYNKEIKKITFQEEQVPLFISQLSGQNVTRFAQVAADQFTAHKESDGKVILIAPTYFLPIRTDCLHFTNQGMQWLGEYFAEAYQQTIVEGKKFEPLRPTRVQIENFHSILVTYNVPYPPLVLDTANVSDPGAFGFDVVSNGNFVPVVNVSIANGNSVRIQLGGQGITLQTTFVRYGLNQSPGSCIGPQRGARGNLRDSNPKVSRLGNTLYNWSVQYNEYAYP